MRLPKEGKGQPDPPTCNTEAMNLHLVEIAATVAPGAHAVLWSIRPAGTVRTSCHQTSQLWRYRECELNPVENVWQFLRDNWLSNRVKSYDDLVDTAARDGTIS